MRKRELCFCGTQQRFPATYTPSDSENYKSVDTYITLTVSKKSVIVSAEAADVTYGDPVPAFTATAKGFTGDDTLDNIGGYVDMQTVYNPGDEEHNGVGWRLALRRHDNRRVGAVVVMHGPGVRGVRAVGVRACGQGCGQ